METYTNLDGIFFDLGGTLRIQLHNDAYQHDARCRLAALAGSDMDPEAFFELMNERYVPYRTWAFDTNQEANDFDLWHKWMLPECGEALIRENCHQLSFWYRQCPGYRVVSEHAPETIAELHRRGYKLGIISNLIGENEIQDWLRDDDLEKYFETVVVSARCGLRKPGPDIYWLAAEQLGVPVEKCASVADNLDRDITGAKEARVGKNILYISKEKYEQKKDGITDANRPDVFISDFLELLELFPARK